MHEWSQNLKSWRSTGSQKRQQLPLTLPIFDVQKREATCQNSRSETKCQRKTVWRQLKCWDPPKNCSSYCWLMIRLCNFSLHASCFGRVVFPLMPKFVHESRVMGFPNSQQHFLGSGCLKAWEICTSRAMWFVGLLSSLLNSWFHWKRPKNTHVRQDI